MQHRGLCLASKAVGSPDDGRQIFGWGKKRLTHLRAPPAGKTMTKPSRRSMLHASALLVAVVLASCATAPPSIAPVVKPTGPQWNALADAKKQLGKAQADLAEKQKSLDAAQVIENHLKSGKTAYQPLFDLVTSPADKTKLQAAVTAQATAATTGVASAQSDVAGATQSVAAAQTNVNQAEAALDATTRADFEAKFATVLTACKAIVNNYQGQSTSGAKVAFWLQVSGLVAGAVAAPALVAASSVGNKAWIAGVSGYAGGTNLAETSLGSANLNGVSDATTANQLVTQIRTDITTALTKTSWDDRYDALNAVVADCALFQIGVPAAPPNNGFGGSNGSTQAPSTGNK